MGWLAVVGLCSVALVAGSARAIVGGQIDGSRHPSVGFLLGVNAQGRPYYSCSGTLVTLRLFVTAAHCTGGLTGLPSPSEVRVVFDSRVTSFDPTVYVSGQAHPNPLFIARIDDKPTAEQRSEDYGVVVLDQPANAVFPFVTTSPLPSVGLLGEKINKESFEIVGYGVSWLGKLKDLVFDGYRRYAITDANGNSLIAPAMLELQANPNGADLTDGMLGGGDSGGPVLADGVIVGVMSGSGPGGKTLAARLDTSAARTFLSQY
jgi:hypothetical protein